MRIVLDGLRGNAIACRNDQKVSLFNSKPLLFNLRVVECGVLTDPAWFMDHTTLAILRAIVVSLGE